MSVPDLQLYSHGCFFCSSINFGILLEIKSPISEVIGTALKSPVVYKECCVCVFIGKMVQGELPSQPELALLLAAGVSRRLRQNHRVGRCERHGTLRNPGALQTYPG